MPQLPGLIAPDGLVWLPGRDQPWDPGPGGPITARSGLGTSNTADAGVAASQSTCACPIDPNTQNGDVLVALLVVGGNQTAITPPANWTAIHATPIDDSTTLRCQWYWTRWTTGDSTNPSWSIASPADSLTIVMSPAYAGVLASGNPIDAESAVAEGAVSVAPHTASAITVTASDCWIVTAFGERTNGQVKWSPPPGETERADRTNANGFGGWQANGEINDTNGSVATGSNGPFTASASIASATAAMFAAALKPEPGGGATPITLPETGTGADTLSVAVDAPMAETGTGADALTVTAAVPLVETGVATDTLTVDQGATPKTLPEQGTATDTLTVTAAIGLGETAAGSDTLTVGAAVPLAETGTATDALTVEQAATPKTLAETGSGADSLTVAAAVTLPESTGATDTLTVTAAVPLGESGTGTDALTVLIGEIKTLPETGAGTDSLTVAAAVPLGESGSGADSFPVAQTRTLAETGTGADALTVSVTVAKTLAEAASGNDSLRVTATVGLAELAAAAEQLSATVLLTLAETGVGTDVLVVSIPPPVPPPRWVEHATTAAGLVEGAPASGGQVEGAMVGAGLVEGSSSI